MQFIYELPNSWPPRVLLRVLAHIKRLVIKSAAVWARRSALRWKSLPCLVNPSPSSRRMSFVPRHETTRLREGPSDGQDPEEHTRKGISFQHRPTRESKKHLKHEEAATFAGSSHCLNSMDLHGSRPPILCEAKNDRPKRPSHARRTTFFGGRP